MNEPWFIIVLIAAFNIPDNKLKHEPFLDRMMSFYTEGEYENRIWFRSFEVLFMPTNSDNSVERIDGNWSKVRIGAIANKGWLSIGYFPLLRNYNQIGRCCNQEGEEIREENAEVTKVIEWWDGISKGGVRHRGWWMKDCTYINQY